MHSFIRHFPLDNICDVNRSFANGKIHLELQIAIHIVFMHATASNSDYSSHCVECRVASICIQTKIDLEYFGAHDREPITIISTLHVYCLHTSFIL